ncbi:MAG TPA: HAD-IA family hydrolase [Longimicrobiaceae bacterium]|nr:HAD-IA family hydrolase [Longimicrobiaceae bacterium]
MTVDAPGRRPPTTVLFDLDGTLIDTYRLYLESYRRALSPYLGHAPTAEEIAARRPSAERRFLADWVGPERADECHARMLEQYRALHGALGEGMYDGVREMLAALRSAGLRLGLVTGKGRRAWETTQAELELGRFDVVVTEDDVRAPKPDPEGVLAALRELGAAPEDAVYVGDSAGDLRAGRAAGARVAAALWPKTAPGERERFLEEVRPLAPDWTLDRPADLTRLLAPWC